MIKDITNNGMIKEMTNKEMVTEISKAIHNTNKGNNDVYIDLVNIETNRLKIKVDVKITIDNQHQIYPNGCIYTLFHHKLSNTPFYKKVMDYGGGNNEINGNRFVYLTDNGRLKNEYTDTYYFDLV